MRALARVGVCARGDRRDKDGLAWTTVWTRRPFARSSPASPARAVGRGAPWPRLRVLPFEDLGFAKIDHHRELRRGFPEVVYCEGKTPEQVAGIVERLAARGPRLLGTRASEAHYAAAAAVAPELHYNESARALWLDRDPDRPRRPGVLLLAAGTSDLPVAEEARAHARPDGPRPPADLRRRRRGAAATARITCPS